MRTNQTHKGKYMVSQFNHIPVCLLCGSVCFVCSLCNKSTQKETMVATETRLPSCVYKTNKPWSYLNRRARGECECCSDQTTATIVCHAVCSSLIICSSSLLLTSYCPVCQGLHSFKSLPASQPASQRLTENQSERLPVDFSIKTFSSVSPGGANMRKQLLLSK